MTQKLGPTSRLPVRENVGPWTYTIGDVHYLDLDSEGGGPARLARATMLTDAQTNGRRVIRITSIGCLALWAFAILVGMETAWAAVAITITAGLITWALFTLFHLRRVTRKLVSARRGSTQRSELYVAMTVLEHVLAGIRDVKADPTRIPQLAEVPNIDQVDPDAYEDFAIALLASRRNEITAPYVHSVTQDINNAFSRTTGLKIKVGV